MLSLVEGGNDCQMMGLGISGEHWVGLGRALQGVIGHDGMAGGKLMSGITNA